MQNATLQPTVVGAVGQSSVRTAKMPLSFVAKGEIATVAKLRDKGELHHHLENLGFVEGAQVKVVCENAGNLIVEIKGTQVALDKDVSRRIITK